MTSNSWLAQHLWIFFYAGGGKCKQTWQKNEMQCCGKMLPSLISYVLSRFSPSPSWACHTGYLQVGGSLISEEFFKAAYHGIPKAEWQVIRVKKEFIPGFIYSLCCLIVSPNGQHVNTILPDVSLTEQKLPNFLDNIRT